MYLNRKSKSFSLHLELLCMLSTTPISTEVVKKDLQADTAIIANAIKKLTRHHNIDIVRGGGTMRVKSTQWLVASNLANKYYTSIYG